MRSKTRATKGRATWSKTRGTKERTMRMMTAIAAVVDATLAFVIVYRAAAGKAGDKRVAEDERENRLKMRGRGEPQLELGPWLDHFDATNTKACVVKNARP